MADEWDCMCNSVPQCNKEIEPERSEEVTDCAESK